MAIKKQHNKLSPAQVQNFRGVLLDWYDQNRRAIAWRPPAGVRPDPYHVWLSEIMCQQTTVAAVIPYFLKFVKTWPDVHVLAKAKQEDVMRAWAGLGYYARARNLHACAKIVSEEFKGVFPDNEKDLKTLPGIGDYTAAAISAIAFGKAATVVDGNVERVIARYFAIMDPLPGSKPLLKDKATLFFKDFVERPGDLAQAFMDLGATVCIPASPRCPLCPVSKLCRGRIEGIAPGLPAKIIKSRPRRFGHVYWVTDRKGRVLLHRRPQKGLLAGMAGLPTSAWEEKGGAIPHPEILRQSKIRDIEASVFHTFTHFDLNLALKTAKAHEIEAPGYYWATPGALEKEGLPAVFMKALKIFQKIPI